MEFLKNVLGSSSASAGQSSHTQQSGAETVERLVERLQSSTLLEDRRDACRALKSLSRKYRVEVGAQGMDAILHILSIDRIDSEIVAYCLESLLNVTSPTLLDDENESMKDVGHQFTEIFTKKSDNISVLLNLLDEYDFRIRLPLIRLFTNLLINQSKEMQDLLLISPMGISKLMDLLSDTREVVRNEALLLLGALTKNNSNIQKIMAFENGFDKILNIIQEEGYSDGGPVVEDCLNLFLSLLRNNTSNQTIFREGNYIKRILPFFQSAAVNNQPPSTQTETDEGWPTQKVSNFNHMLQIVRTLVSPLNPAQVTLNCQKAMKTYGIMECLCNLLMASGIPIETLTEVITTVGELMRGSIENQEYFNYLVAPSEPPRPALVILLMSLVNDSQLLSLRCAIYYCVQCFVYKNEKGQSDIVKTLLPTSTSKTASTITAGQLICSGLFSKDPCSNWFASICLGHTLHYSLAQKELLLKVKLATRAESPPVTLLHHVLTSLNAGPKVQVKLALLQFLAIWLESCPNAISQFLSNPLSVPYLITQITTADMIDKEALVHGLCAFVMGICFYFNPNNVEAFNKENLHQLMTNRIGIEQITNGLNQITKSEYYLQSLKHPQLIAKHSTDLVFDHSFALLFKKYEPLILMQLNNDPAAINANSSGDQNADLTANGFKVNSRESPNAVLSQYKEFIRNQDATIENYKREIAGLGSLNAEYKTRLEEMFGEILQLKSQLTLVQAQRDANGVNQRQIPEDEHLTIVEAKDKRIEELQLQVLRLESHYGNINAIRNPIQEELISKLEEENKALVEEVERTKKDQEELLELLAEQDKRIYEYRVQLRNLGVDIPPDDDEDDDNIARFDQNEFNVQQVQLQQQESISPIVLDEQSTVLNLNLENLNLENNQQQQQEIYHHQQQHFDNYQHQQVHDNQHQQLHPPQLPQLLQQTFVMNQDYQNAAENKYYQPQAQGQPPQPQAYPSSHEHENGMMTASHLFSNNNNSYNGGGGDNFLLNKLPY